MAEFGEWLYRVRKRVGLSQQELADLSGCSKSYISTLERGAVHSGSGGEIRPSEEIVAAIANALNAPINDARLAAGYKTLVYERTESSQGDLIYELDHSDEGLGRIRAAYNGLDADGRDELVLIAEAIVAARRKREQVFGRKPHNE